MSQAGIIDVEGSHPQIPTLFVCNVGSAIPIANTLEILGEAVAAHSIPLETVGSGNTVEIEVQYASAAASSVANNAGVASFNSTFFTVDANGFVSFSGSGGTETLTGNSGGAVPPTANNINTVGTGSITIVGNPGTSTLTTQLTGLTNHAVLVGAGSPTITNVGPTATAGQILQSQGSTTDPAFSTATYPSTTTINQILYSSSANVVGGITAGNNGVLISGTTGIPSWLADGTTGQVLTATTGSPPSWANPATSGTVTSVSVVTANGFAGTVATATTTPAITLTTTVTGVLSGNGTAISGSAITQHDVLVGGASNAITSVSPSTAGLVLTSNGVSADPSFQAVSASGAITTITGNSGGAESPTAGGNFNILGTGSITVAGSTSTETVQLTGLTNHNVLVGAGTATITNVAPSATSGVPLISQGSSSDPAFGTAVVAGGGTGDTSFTAYAPICGGTTTTGALQSASTGIGTSGFVLTSNGSSALPSFQAVAVPSFSINVQVFTNSGTYTPTSGMAYCIIEAVGGGGGGGGAVNSAAAQGTAASGGGAGGYSRLFASAATIGASQTVTIGALGAGGANTGATGGTGGATSVGALLTANGGVGGGGSNSSAVSITNGNPGNGGTASGGTVNVQGTAGGSGFGTFPVFVAGYGGSSVFGGGAPLFANGGTASIAANGYGSGGGGATTANASGASAGGNGAAGVVIITEYII